MYTYRKMAVVGPAAAAAKGRREESCQERILQEKSHEYRNIYSHSCPQENLLPNYHKMFYEFVLFWLYIAFRGGRVETESWRT